MKLTAKFAIVVLAELAFGFSLGIAWADLAGPIRFLPVAGIILNGIIAFTYLQDVREALNSLEK